jgi:TonB family protein
MTILWLFLVSTCSVAFSQTNQRAQPASTGFTLTRQVTEYDDRGNAFPTILETLYVSSRGDWRYVGTYPNGQVVETMYLFGRGGFFHDYKNSQLVKFADIGPMHPGPTTAERLMNSPEFVGTEYVLDRLAYLHRRKLDGLIEEFYFTPATGPFPFKSVSYYEGRRLVQEPLSLTLGEPDVAQLRGEDYPLVEQKILQVGTQLSNKIQDQPAPQYPSLARAAGLHGKVELEVIVDEIGQVIKAIALSGPPLLKEAALEAAYRARLAPTEKNGKPIKVKGYLIYQFQPEPAPANQPGDEKPN